MVLAFRVSFAAFATSRKGLCLMAKAREENAKKADDDSGDVKLVRLHVVLARCGVGSRRDCEELITEGRVAVDNKVITELGASVRPDQKIKVDGQNLRPERKMYYMVNKPKGLICTNEDPQGRPCVVDMFPKNSGRLFTVGRLDENSIGLILVTNDGELAHRLAHPKFEVPKIYRVQVAGTPTQETLVQLRRGVHFSDGKFKIEGIRSVKTKGRSSILEVILLEGQNREVRRLFARVGHKVMQLERVGFGPLRLKDVLPGRFRSLTPQERMILLKYAAQDPSQHKRLIPDELPMPPPKPKPKPMPVEKGPSLVEVSAVQRRGRADMTGRRLDRFGQTVTPQRFHDEFDSDVDGPMQDLSRHPAFGGRPVAPRTDKRPAGSKSLIRSGRDNEIPVAPKFRAGSTSKRHPGAVKPGRAKKAVGKPGRKGR